MRDVEYEIVHQVPANDQTWKEWRELVESEGWISDDRSVLTLTPIVETTRIVLARKKDDGSFIGSVVWNEYDNVSLIGFYLIIPAYRGKGIGSLLWKKAIERMPKSYTIILRAVPDMALRYMSRDTPIQGVWMHSYSIDCKTLMSVVEENVREISVAKLVCDLNKERYRSLEEFDKSVTGRDRTLFLKRFHNLDFTQGSVLFDTNDNIIACASVSPTSRDDSHLFKLSQVYASNLEDALRVMKPLIKYIIGKDPLSIFVIHILDRTIGAELLLPLLTALKLPPKVCGVTLFSKQYKNPIDLRKLFIAHNNSVHFDA